ncbi:MAG: 4Fe-4S dicluster domain-containing protein [Elusimicrobiota bacterium]
MAKVVIDRERCKGCSLCQDVCVKGCLALSPDLNAYGHHPVLFNREELCTGCGHCYQMCPDVCIEIFAE